MGSRPFTPPLLKEPYAETQSDASGKEGTPVLLVPPPHNWAENVPSGPWRWPEGGMARPCPRRRSLE